MPKGGHSKVGPLPRTAAQQVAVGGRVRPKHRQPRSLGTRAPASAVKAPPHLTALERAQWTYYAPLLEQVGRLTYEARDTLAKYCTVLAQVVLIKKAMAVKTYRTLLLSHSVSGSGVEHVTAKTNPLNIALRNWLETARKYEADLLLNPASAIRAPGPPPTAQDPPHEAEAEADEQASAHDFYGDGPRRPM